MSIYTLWDCSFKIDDVYGCSDKIAFITTDKEKAIAEFKKEEKFCMEYQFDGKWVYKYCLVEWVDERNCNTLMECCNLTDDD